MRQRLYGAPTLTLPFDNDPQGFGRLARWLRKRRVAQLHACMEATGAYGDELAMYLHATGHQVSAQSSKGTALGRQSGSDQSLCSESIGAQ